MSKINYLEKYASNNTRKFQEGGQMPEGGAPAPEAPQAGGGQPDIEGMLAQFAQSQDPQLAVEICNALVSMMGAQAEQGQPMPAQRNGGRMSYQAPMFKKGGKL